jgi:hypothetical protein
MVQIIEFSPKTPEASERDLARKLRQQVCEWKMMRVPLRTCTALACRSSGVPDSSRPSSACPPDGHLSGSSSGTLFVRTALVLESVTTGEPT